MLNGIINIYKTKGFTSHDVVAKMRGILKQKKIGHTGTLDPDAEGVLPICLGNATKLCDMLTEKDKEYRAVLLLGITTDTQDISGKILEKKDVPRNEEEIRAAVRHFEGEYMQLPPMYSAIKINGKKLVDLARKGIEVERKRRKVFLYSIEIEKVNPPRVVIRVHCSKGTYIRTLCHDIGKLLGCGACMESLIRTKSGRFMMEDAVRLTELETMDRRELERILLSPEDVFSDTKRLELKPDYDRYGNNGNKLRPRFFVNEKVLEEDQHFKIYSSKGIFLGLYEYVSKEDILKPIKMFL